MQEIAGGDAERLAHLREISSWFPSVKEINDEVFAVRAAMYGEELARCFPDFQPQRAMAALLWALLEAELPIPAKRLKWAAFRSHLFGLEPLHGDEVEVVMGLPAPGTCTMPIEIFDEEVAASWRVKNKKEVVTYPHHSPRFPRRSARLRALSNAE